MIRPLNPEADFRALVEIEGECFKDAWGEDEISCQLAGTGCEGIVAEEDNRPVGFLLHEPTSCGRYISDLAVRPSHQRRGIGRTLMQKLIETGELLALHVATKNTAARRLYKSLGFIQSGHESEFYGDDDALLLVRLW